MFMDETDTGTLSLDLKADMVHSCEESRPEQAGDGVFRRKNFKSNPGQPQHPNLKLRLAKTHSES